MSELFRQRPQILQDISPEFDWDSQKIWQLDLPVQEMNIDDLLWHFDLPFWEKEGTDDWNLTPWEVIKRPESEPTHFVKIQAADLRYPIDLFLYKGRYRILDGLHRLAKAYLNDQKTVQVRIVPEEMTNLIQK